MFISSISGTFLIDDCNIHGDVSLKVSVKFVNLFKSCNITHCRHLPTFMDIFLISLLLLVTSIVCSMLRLASSSLIMLWSSVKLTSLVCLLLNQILYPLGGTTKLVCPASGIISEIFHL